jgi:hypothetical protein
MADTVELGGKSKYEVAHEMTRVILVTLEKKDHYKDVTRQEYLETVRQCISTLNGNKVV